MSDISNAELGGFALDGLNAILGLPLHLLLRKDADNKDAVPQLVIYNVLCWDYKPVGRTDTDKCLRVQAFRVVPDAEAQERIEAWKKMVPERGEPPSQWYDALQLDAETGDTIQFYKGHFYAKEWKPAKGQTEWSVVTDVGPDTLRRVCVSAGFEDPTPSYGMYGINGQRGHKHTWWMAAQHLLPAEVVAEQMLDPNVLIELGEWLPGRSDYSLPQPQGFDRMGRFWVESNHPLFVIERQFKSNSSSHDRFYRPDWAALA